MERERISEILKEVFDTTEGNTITKEQAQEDWEEIKGLLIYDEPIFGIADANDPIFLKYKEPEVIGPWFKAPGEWNSTAKSVLSIFFPFTDRVKESNISATDICSKEWAYGRVEGQAFQTGFIKNLCKYFEDKGIHALAPMICEDFFSIKAGMYDGVNPNAKLTSASDIGAGEETFSSNWSERHAAFAAGLGTFGLSRGIITKKGMAGRFCSVILSEYIEPDVRPYTDIYEYCIKCGACAKRCPVDAMHNNSLKDHSKCYPWIKHSGEVLSPRYGCGLCQTKVPCQNGIPKKNI